MASPTWWTWVWVNSRSWWRIGRPGVLQIMGLQEARHDWVTELNWTLWETFLMLINPLLFIVNHSELNNSRVDLFWIFQLLNAQSLWIAQRHLVFGLSPKSRISFMHSPIPQPSCKRKKKNYYSYSILSIVPRKCRQSKLITNSCGVYLQNVSKIYSIFSTLTFLVSPPLWLNYHHSFLICLEFYPFPPGHKSHVIYSALGAGVKEIPGNFW